MLETFPARTPRFKEGAVKNVNPVGGSDNLNYKDEDATRVPNKSNLDNINRAESIVVEQF